MKSRMGCGNQLLHFDYLCCTGHNLQYHMIAPGHFSTIRWPVPPSWLQRMMAAVPQPLHGLYGSHDHALCEPTILLDPDGSETRRLCCEQGTKGPPCLWSVIPELAHKWGLPQHPPRDLVSARAAPATPTDVHSQSTSKVHAQGLHNFVVCEHLGGL